MAAIVGIISKHGLRIKACHRNQPNKCKLSSYTICNKTFEGENLLVFMDFANCKCLTIEQLHVMSFALKSYLQVAKLWSIYMATGGNSPRFH